MKTMNLRWENRKNPESSKIYSILQQQNIDDKGNKSWEDIKIVNEL